MLLAFTFAAAACRSEIRRNLIIEASNAIGDTALRADLYPEVERQGFLTEFLDYLEARIAFYEAGRDKEKFEDSLSRSDEVKKAVVTCNEAVEGAGELCGLTTHDSRLE